VRIKNPRLSDQIESFHRIKSLVCINKEFSTFDRNGGITLRLTSLFAPVVVGIAFVFTHATSAAQDIAATQAKMKVCVLCHGADGNSIAGVFPSLAGQPWRSIYIQLKDFKEERRKDPMMSQFAMQLSREDMIDIANFYAVQTPKPSTFQTDDAKVKLGKEKSDEARCNTCHLNDFSGRNDVPRVAGQQYEYIVKQMNDYKARRRTNDGGTMTSLAQKLSDSDIENLAHYITSLR
jgi:cytochrome c553